MQKLLSPWESFLSVQGKDTVEYNKNMATEREEGT